MDGLKPRRLTSEGSKHHSSFQLIYDISGFVVLLGSCEANKNTQGKNS